MRNIFDQYSQPENRLSHALLKSLENDRQLLKSFLLWSTGRAVGRSRVQIYEQSLPGDPIELSEEDAQQRGLPDGCLTDGESWAVLIESKFQARPSVGQLRRHLKTAKRRGLPDACVLLLSIHPPPKRLPRGVYTKQWSEVYRWLTKFSGGSLWARYCLEYFQVTESKKAADEYLKEGKLTVFSGIPFNTDVPYTYPQAKRLLGLIREELCRDKRLAKHLDADLAALGRTAITGREGRGVWDFIPLKHARAAKVFTQYPHLTIGILDDRVGAHVTIPNGIRSRLRTNLLGESRDDFQKLIQETTMALVKSLGRVKGFVPEIIVMQRHYLSQRSAGVVDCQLRFDARTTLPKGSRHRGKVRPQPQWLLAAYDALESRRSNLQLQIGGSFPYLTCPTTQDQAIVRAIADVWLACAPVLKRATE